MSSTLYWKPQIRDGKHLPDELKRALEKGFSLGSDGRVFTYEDYQYLKALEDQEVEGATELIGLISKHEEVMLWLKY